MIKKLLILLLLFTFSLFSFVKTNAVELEALSDKFTLLDKSYDVNQGFVYTARANFISGQAAGIVFGASEDEYYYVLLQYYMKYTFNLYDDEI